MAIRERLVYAIDVVTDGANKGLKSFRTAISDAEGATGKFKAGASSAMASVQAHAASLAVAGGTALVAFGVKSVMAFQDGALAAGKFSDATGIAVEDASRWVEVANDMGVSTEAIQGGFVKLEKAIGSNSPAVKELGIEVVRTANGTADMNATMLDAIEKLGQIEDPAKRAKAATDLFGRGFADMAEVVLADADSIRGRLEEVSDAQVFDADEVKKARELRDSIDNVKDKFEQLALTLGGELAPAVSDVADSLSDLVEAADAVKVPELLKFGVENTALNRVRQLFELFSDGKDEIETFAASQARGIDGTQRLAFEQERLAGAVEEGNSAFSQYTANLKTNAAAATEAAEENAAAIDRLARSYEELLDELSDRSSFLDVQDAFDDMANTADKSMREQERDVIKAKQSIAEYAEEIGNVPTETSTQIIALVDAGRYNEALALLDNLERTRTARLNVTVNSRGDLSGFVNGRRATGGSTRRGGLYEVAEGGKSELLHEGGKTYLMSGADGNVEPISGSVGGGSTGGGGVVINAYITANDAESVFDKLAREVRMKGPGPVKRALGID
jgi:hypothetical protein